MGVGVGCLGGVIEAGVGSRSSLQLGEGSVALVRVWGPMLCPLHHPLGLDMIYITLSSPEVEARTGSPHLGDFGLSEGRTGSPPSLPTEGH